MILWCDGDHDPLENMRRDSLLLEAAGSGPSMAPVLRLFRFRPHGITLGYAQRPERELDLDRCLEDGVPWAVRPTGGRAIFHSEEWTYSLAARLDDPQWGGTLTEAYDAISILLVRSLNRLGVPASHHAPPRGRSRSTPAATGSLQVSVSGSSAVPNADMPPGASGISATAMPCFASTTNHEVVLDGRKLVGSAQRRTARALLQQGSVLLGSGHLRLTDYLAVRPVSRAVARAALDAHAADAGAFLGVNPPIEAWAAALTHELPGVRRIDGAAGLFLLTPPEPSSYTASLP